MWSWFLSPYPFPGRVSDDVSSGVFTTGGEGVLTTGGVGWAGGVAAGGVGVETGGVTVGGAETTGGAGVVTGGAGVVTGGAGVVTGGAFGGGAGFVTLVLVFVLAFAFAFVFVFVFVLTFVVLSCVGSGVITIGFVCTIGTVSVWLSAVPMSTITFTPPTPCALSAGFGVLTVM